MTVPLGSRLSISVDSATARLVREISEQTTTSMSQILKDAVSEYLLRPEPESVHHVAAGRVIAGRQLGRAGEQQRPPSVGGRMYPYTPPEDRRTDQAAARNDRGLGQRLSFSLSSQLRRALEDRARREERGFSDVVRTGLDFYLFDVIRRVSLADSARADDGRPLTEVTATFD